MEELGKALAEAIRAGKDLAPMAIWGYYLVRIGEAFATPLSFLGVALTAGFTVRACINRVVARDELQLAAKAHEERHALLGTIATLREEHRSLLIRVTKPQSYDHRTRETTFTS